MARNRTPEIEKYINSKLSFLEKSTRERITNLQVSVFQWDGLVDKLGNKIVPSSEVLEMMLLAKGNVGAFDTNTGLKIYNTVSTSVDSWGYPAEGTHELIAYNGFVQQIDKVSTPIILYDQPNHKSIMQTLELYGEELKLLRNAKSSITTWLGNPLLFGVPETQLKSMQYLLGRIYTGGAPIITAENAVDLKNVINIPTLASPAALEAIQNAIKVTESAMFEELGVPDMTVAKMAQLTQTEALLPIMATSLKTRKRLAMRQAWADKVNELYGTNISVQAIPLGMLEQSMYSSTGRLINLSDINSNGIPDKLEVENNE